MLAASPAAAGGRTKSPCEVTWPTTFTSDRRSAGPVQKLLDGVGRRQYFARSLQPKLAGLPAGQRGGTNSLAQLGMGRRAVVVDRPGHFHDRARQLTSSAFGRAIHLPPLGRGDQ